METGGAAISMEYKVKSLAVLAGVSPRTLRHYDVLGLLRPASTRPSGYRVYGGPEVDRLQQILFFRELDVPLEEIRRILDAPGYDAVTALRRHRKDLMERWTRLEKMIGSLDRTIEEKEGRNPMTDKEKFEAFKKGMVQENEAKYGAEVRRKYGDDAVDGANRRILAMDETKIRSSEELAGEVISKFLAAFETGDPTGPLAHEAAALHRLWLETYWKHYTKEAHAGVVRMYVEDPRFTGYYDRHKSGLAVFLRDAVLSWLGDGKM
jgi:DNA-binding transcriptional MerR regulator